MIGRGTRMDSKQTLALLGWIEDPFGNMHPYPVTVSSDGEGAVVYFGDQTSFSCSYEELRSWMPMGGF